MTESRASERSRLRTRLREKLPEILIEAGSVVLALLLALAVNAWHDNAQQNDRAEVARTAILAELRANQQELKSKQAKLKENLAALNAVVDAKPPAEIHEFNFEMGLALLSAAAWHAALATEAIRRTDFAWLTHIATVYELQDNYLRQQTTAIDQLATFTPDDSRSPRQMAASLMSRVKILIQVGDSLDRAYAEALDPKSG
jgi:cell division protein FtsB